MRATRNEAKLSALGLLLSDTSSNGLGLGDGYFVGTGRVRLEGSSRLNLDGIVSEGAMGIRWI